MDNFSPTGVLAAHELGHALGAKYHDDELDDEMSMVSV